MTKAQIAKHEALLAKHHAARDAVYAAAAPRNDVRFCDCLTMAQPGVVATHYAAQKALGDYEWQLIQEDRGYRDTYGRFRSNTR